MDALGKLLPKLQYQCEHPVLITAFLVFCPNWNHFLMPFFLDITLPPPLYCSTASVHKMNYKNQRISQTFCILSTLSSSHCANFVCRSCQHNFICFWSHEKPKIKRTMWPFLVFLAHCQCLYIIIPCKCSFS